MCGCVATTLSTGSDRPDPLTKAAKGSEAGDPERASLRLKGARRRVVEAENPIHVEIITYSCI